MDNSMQLSYEELVRRTHDELFAALPGDMTARELSLIEDAFLLARGAHARQQRESGQPYILHPLNVAQILVREMMQKDAAIIAAALLHDVVEDTAITAEDIRDRFGEDVAFLVKAVTKPNKKQVDNYQHILGSVKGDIRVLLLKLSDRLHNMRTLSSLKPQKRWKIASETRFFYAPLAGRLGLFSLKVELENLAFQFLNPCEYSRIASLLEEDRERTAQSLERFVDECRRHLGGEMGGPVGWGVRYRKPYSVWREMQERHCDFHRIPFKHYIRVNFDRMEMDDAINYTSARLLTDEDIVFRIYALLSARYREQTGSFVNYISQPKANGYRSVHFRLLNPYGGIEEFHVASDEMRLQSDYGCILDSEEQWLSRLTEVLGELSEDTESMMPGICDSLYYEDIVAFTPKCMAVVLPKGATALDFAYGVHSSIGEHAQYARINGRLSSIRTELHRGDCVEIGVDEAVAPREDWLDSVVTYRAKKCIRASLNRRPSPRYSLCPNCHPMPGGEVIGFRDSSDQVMIHSRSCPEAIRTASEKGNTIVVVDDFAPDPDILYPVEVAITGVDRYHFLQDILDCIVERGRMSLTSLSIHAVDSIVTCSIGFSVHGSEELTRMVAAIRDIPGVEEISVP